MNVGTKSLLFGAHQVFIHPWFIALGWWRLYGFPFDPRLWLCFIIHDWGYWGKPNMDGKEGETHVEWAAQFMRRYFGPDWGKVCLYHSRFYCERDAAAPSRLCYADKLAIVYEPWWLYLPRAWLSGEIHEYRKITREREGKYSDMEVSGDGPFRQWYGKLCAYLKRWVYEQPCNDRRRRA